MKTIYALLAIAFLMPAVIYTGDKQWLQGGFWFACSAMMCFVSNHKPKQPVKAMATRRESQAEA